MTDVILLTVWHTGTKYFLDGLEKHYNRATYSHLNDAWKRKAEKHDIVYTAYRDPLETIASWGNRGHFKSKNSIKKWMDQWSFYKELENIEPIVLKLSNGRNQHGIEFADHKINDFQGVDVYNQGLSQKNIDYIYSKLPKQMIDHAYECSEWAKNK